MRRNRAVAGYVQPTPHTQARGVACDERNIMYRATVGGFAIAAVLSGALNAAVIGLAPSSAKAASLCSPSEVKEPRCAPPEGPPFGCDAFGNCAQIWCPASGMEGLPHWDRNGPCHTFWFDPNAPATDPVMIEGRPPGPPPPPPPPCIPLVNCLPGLTHPLP
jgi:hypothetical protein